MILIHFFKWIFFRIPMKNGEKIKDYFWGFFGVDS